MGILSSVTKARRHILIWIAIGMFSSAAIAAKPNLADVVRLEMLRADVGYFEHVAGPPWKRNEKFRIYKVAGCLVTAGVDSGEVISIKVGLSPKCSFDLQSLVPNLDAKVPSTAYQLTFGKFDQLSRGGGQFYSDCITDCGNAADPFVWQHWQGSRADSSIEVLLEVVVAGDQAVEAASELAKLMLAEHGEQWVWDGKFNCGNGKFDKAAHLLFKDVRITAITVGYDIRPSLCKTLK